MKVKKANKKKCKTFFWQKKCCLLAVFFHVDIIELVFQLRNKLPQRVFFQLRIFFKLVFFPLKNKKTSNPTNPPCSVFSVFCCLRLAEEEGGRGRGEPDAQLRSGSQQPRGEGEGGEEM